MACKCKNKKVYAVYIVDDSNAAIQMLRLFWREEQAQAFANLQSASLTEGFSAVVQSHTIEA